MSPDPLDSGRKKVVCPICFDLGFADSVVWEHIANETASSDTVAQHGSGSGAGGKLGEGKTRDATVNGGRPRLTRY